MSSPTVSPHAQPEQNFANHAKLVPLFHFVLGPIALLTVIGSFVNLFKSFGDHSRLYNAALICLLSILVVFALLFARSFALKAQDRAIRAEENLRHFVLTGKLLDRRLTMGQIVGLRFASDAEFPALAAKAAADSIAPREIKRAVKNWKIDHDRL